MDRIFEKYLDAVIWETGLNKKAAKKWIRTVCENDEHPRTVLDGILCAYSSRG